MRAESGRLVPITAADLVPVTLPSDAPTDPTLGLVRLRRERPGVIRWEAIARSPQGPVLLNTGLARDDDLPWPDHLADYENYMFGRDALLPASPPDWPYFSISVDRSDVQPGYLVWQIWVQQVRSPRSPLWYEARWHPDRGQETLIRGVEYLHTEAQLLAASRGAALIRPVHVGRPAGSGWTVKSRREFRERYDPVVTRLKRRRMIDAARAKWGPDGKADTWRKQVRRDLDAAQYREWIDYLVEFEAAG